MAEVQFQRRLITLGAVAGALAVAFVLGLVFSPLNVQKRLAEAPLLPGFKSDSVGKISIGGTNGPVELEKGDKGWSVLIGGQPYPASSERLASFFELMASIKRSRIVSANPQTWKSFEVDQEAKLRLKMLDSAGKTLTDLIVGKAPEGERGNYVRVDGRNEVMEVNRSLGFYLDSEPSFWSHLKFFPAELRGEDIMRISVRSDLAFSDGSSRRLNWTVVQSQETGRNWKVVAPAGQQALALDNKEVDKVANALAGFEGSEFVTSASSADSGLAAPSAEVLFSTVKNQDYRILIGKPSGKDQYYAKVDGGSYLYLSPEWRLKQILKTLGELAPKPVSASQ
jgi:hypothetical protein